MQSKSPGALYAELGEVLYQANRFDEAAEMLQKALQDDAPDLPRAQTYLKLHEVYKALKKPAEALRALASAVNIEPSTFEHAKDYLSVAVPQPGQAILDRITRYISEVVSGTPTQTVLKSIADDLMKAAKYSDAEQVLRLMTGSWPDEADVWERLGRVLLEQEKDEECVRAYQRAVDLDGKRAEAHRRQGEALARLRRYKEASEALSRSLALAPADPQALLDRGVVRRELGLLEDSQRDLEEAVRQFPNHMSAYLELATTQQARREKNQAADTLTKAVALLLQQERFQEAETLSRMAHEWSPANRRACIQLGRALTRQSRYDDAVAVLREADSLERDAELRTEIAGAYLAQGKYEKALEEIDRALAVAQEDVPAMMHKGIILNRLGRYQEAAQWLDRSLERSQTVEALFEKGVALDALDRPEEALDSLAKAVALDPKFRLALRLMGALLLRQERYAEALPTLDQALALEPEDGPLNAKRGKALFNLGRYEEAVPGFDLALKRNSSDVESIRFRGSCLRRIGRLEEAATTLQLAIDLGESLGKEGDFNAFSYAELGEVLRLQNRHREAVSAFRKALTLRQDDPFAFSHLGETLRVLEEYAEAVENLQQALKLKPDDTWALSCLGAALMSMEQYRSALATLEKSIRLNPTDSWTWTVKASVLRLNSRWKAALEACNKALEQGPDAAWILAEQGIALYAQGKPEYDVAREVLEKATRIDNSYGWAFLQLGICLFRMARHGEAIQAADRALTLSHSEPEATTLKNLLLHRLGKQELISNSLLDAQACLERARHFSMIGAVEEAIGDFLKAIELKPDSVDAHNELAWMYGISGKWQSALHPAQLAEQMVRKAKTTNREKGNVVDTLGWIHFQLGNLEEARRLLEEAVLLNDENLEIMDHLEVSRKAPAAVGGVH